MKFTTLHYTRWNTPKYTIRISTIIIIFLSNLKVCNKCYKTSPTQNVTTIIPPNYNNDSNQEHTSTNFNTIKMITTSTQIQKVTMSNIYYSSYSTVTSDQINDVIQNVVTYSEQDTSLNLTDENMNCGESFTTTNDAESPINILQHNTYDTISGYVIFNQVGNCKTY